MKVYLGGPINGCTDEEATGWREAVKEILDERGIDWLDPMVRDYRGREMEPGIASEIVENDKADIRECDVLLMNCPAPSVGTSMEIFYGWTLAKLIIAVVPGDRDPSPWIVYHASLVHAGSVSDAARDL